MGVDFHIAHVRRKNKKQPFFEIEESHWVDGFSSINALARDEILETFTQEKNLLAWLSKVGSKHEPTVAKVSKASEIVDSILQIYEILERENNHLPSYYWVGFGTSQGILKSNSVYALVAGELWFFCGGWNQCYGYPYKEGERSQNFFDLMPLENFPKWECYPVTVPDGNSPAYNRYFRGDAPDELYIERMTYFDFYKPVLERVLEICRKADDYVYIYVS